MGAKVKYTEEERAEIKKSQYLLKQKPKEAATHKRLAPLRFESGRMSKKERREFKSEIREINQKRFDDIFNNPNLWEIINKSSDDYLEKKESKVVCLDRHSG